MKKFRKVVVWFNGEESTSILVRKKDVSKVEPLLNAFTITEDFKTDEWDEVSFRKFLKDCQLDFIEIPDNSVNFFLPSLE